MQFLKIPKPFTIFFAVCRFCSIFFCSSSPLQNIFRTGAILAASLVPFLTAQAQITAQVSPSATEVFVNEPFSLKAFINTPEVKEVNFPDLPGLQRSGPASLQLRGATVVAMQQYLPQRVGPVTIRTLTLSVDGQQVKAAGFMVMVKALPVIDTSRKPLIEPGDKELLEKLAQKQKQAGDAVFLDFSVNKEQVLVGEAFHVRLAFFVAEENTSNYQFYHLADQLSRLTKTIKPADCWEESFNIEEVKPASVRLNGRSYTAYKIFEASYFPLHPGPISWPAMTLDMQRHKPGDDDNEPELVTYKTTPRQLRVQALPANVPQGLPVGQFSLQEEISNNRLGTNQSAVYRLTISGYGHPGMMPEPVITEGKASLLQQDRQLKLQHQDGKLYTQLTLTYAVVPAGKGMVPLSELIQISYFNTQTKQVEQLQPRTLVNLLGTAGKRAEAASPTAIAGNVQATDLELLVTPDNALRPISGYDDWRRMANYGLAFLFFVGTILMFWRRK